MRVTAVPSCVCIPQQASVLLQDDADDGGLDAVGLCRRLASCWPASGVS